MQHIPAIRATSATAVAIVSLFLLIRSTVANICSGIWIENDDTEVAGTMGDGGLGYLRAGDTTLMCPADTFMFSCLFHQAIPRSFDVLKRRFVPKGKNCIPYSPLEFLGLIRNRKLYLIGDSIMLQVFQTLACSLHMATKSIFRIRWEYTFKSPKVCPLHSVHCHIGGGLIQFPLLNSSIVYRNMYTYHRKSLMNEVLIGCSVEDVVILNIGAHYNAKEEFEEHMQNLATDLYKIRHYRGSPIVLFRESLPTHFSYSVNQSGYFQQGEVSTSCKPYSHIMNTTEIYNKDWRNRIADKYLNLSNIDGVIRMAEALYSQYDAHIDGDSKVFTPPLSP